jgi:hypothetical protein
MEAPPTEAKHRPTPQMKVTLKDLAPPLPLYRHEWVLFQHHSVVLFACTTIHTTVGTVDTSFILKDISLPEQHEIMLISYDINAAITAYNEYHSPQ